MFAGGDLGSGSISHHRCVIAESPSGENSRSPLNDPWNLPECSSESESKEMIMMYSRSTTRLLRHDLYMHLELLWGGKCVHIEIEDGDMEERPPKKQGPDGFQSWVRQPKIEQEEVQICDWEPRPAIMTTANSEYIMVRRPQIGRSAFECSLVCTDPVPLQFVRRIVDGKSSSRLNGVTALRRSPYKMMGGGCAPELGAHGFYGDVTEELP
ncbi:hypothetical protein BDR06DRAFT_977462 [Suillus hirtellus]|nr:hypothetical protein BDR06DRAFT_977462 [Suillus hirtellus]